MVVRAVIDGCMAYFDPENCQWVITTEEAEDSEEVDVLDYIHPCPKCGEKRRKEGEDACLGHLPGVKYACCGHGEEEGYISFDNGMVIRGWFTQIYDSTPRREGRNERMGR